MVKKFTLCLLLSGAAALCSLCLGAARLMPSELWQAVVSGPAHTAGYIFWYVRLPRTAGCLLAGAAMAVSGAVIQGVLHNRLASPSIIGVNAGAGLAVTVCCALGAISGWVIAGAAFCGAMVTVTVIVLVAQKAGASRTTVILGGVAVNATLNSICEGITTLVPDIAMMTADFRTGGFGSVSYLRLIPAAFGIFLALALLFALHNELDVLTLGDETAHSLGLRVHRMRPLLLGLAAMLSGCAVSFAGLLGFVGLIVPHAVRKLVGSESRFLLPMCAIAGAGFVTFCDLAARLLFAPYELPVGILLSMLGGPFFLFLLLKQKGGRQYA